MKYMKNKLKKQKQTPGNRGTRAQTNTNFMLRTDERHICFNNPVINLNREKNDKGIICRWRCSCLEVFLKGLGCVLLFHQQEELLLHGLGDKLWRRPSPWCWCHDRQVRAERGAESITVYCQFTAGSGETATWEWTCREGVRACTSGARDGWRMGKVMLLLGDTLRAAQVKSRHDR